MMCLSVEMLIEAARFTNINHLTEPGLMEWLEGILSFVKQVWSIVALLSVTTVISVWKQLRYASQLVISSELILILSFGFSMWMFVSTLDKLMTA
jgi:hypothetical protein